MAQTAKARKRPPSRLVTLPSEIKLFIMDPLSLAEVGRLCRAHTSWRDIAQYCMYKKDVAEDTSTAVLWAALGGRDDPTGRYEMQCYVLKRFMQWGQAQYHNDADKRAFAQAKVNARYVGDDGTFATALHFAAAKGRQAPSRRAAAWALSQSPAPIRSIPRRSRTARTGPARWPRTDSRSAPGWTLLQ